MKGTKRYLEYGTAGLEVPSVMIGFDKNKHQHLYNTLTKKGSLSHHNGISAVKLGTKSRGNHIRAIKGALVNVVKKERKVRAKSIKNHATALAVQGAQVELAEAVHDLQIKKRGRKALSPEEKAKRVQLRKEKASLKKAENKKIREAKKAEKLATKAPKKKTSTGKRGRPRKMAISSLLN